MLLVWFLPPLHLCSPNYVRAIHSSYWMTCRKYFTDNLLPMTDRQLVLRRKSESHIINDKIDSNDLVKKNVHGQDHQKPACIDFKAIKNLNIWHFHASIGTGEFIFSRVLYSTLKICILSLLVVFITEQCQVNSFHVLNTPMSTYTNCYIFPSNFCPLMRKYYKNPFQLNIKYKSHESRIK